ncbi:MAG: hypothetical protein AAFV53_26130 [Myxococcota bacterium]
MNQITHTPPTDAELAARADLLRLCRDTLTDRVIRQFDREVMHPDPHMATRLRRSGSLIASELLQDAALACLEGHPSRERLERLVTLAQAVLDLHDLRIERFRTALSSAEAHASVPVTQGELDRQIEIARQSGSIRTLNRLLQVREARAGGASPPATASEPPSRLSAPHPGEDDEL